MAGGGAADSSRQKRGDTGKRKKMKRLKFSADMTPMVDITMLLLTFFLFTTTMLKPQIMEMKIPPESNENVDVRASELLQLYLRDDGKLFYSLGQDDPKAIDFKKLRNMVVEENLKPNVKNKLITSFKISKDVKYDFVIKVLDELNLAEVPITQALSKETDPQTNQPVKRKRKFTLAELTTDDIQKIGAIK